MNVSIKQDRETEQVKRFFRDLERDDIQLLTHDRPDVIAKFDQHRIGIEVTDLHPDERKGIKGSPIRVIESNIYTNSDQAPYSVWGEFDYIPALVKRIEEKSKSANEYNKVGLKELWLLICCQVPQRGAIGATHLSSATMDAGILNESTSSIIRQSVFESVHLYFMMEHSIWSWSDSNQWSETRKSTLTAVDFKSILGILPS